MSVGNLPPEQIQGLRELFNELDTDHSGSIDKNEMTPVLNMCAIPLELTPVIFKICDKNGDGSITFDEFCNFLVSYAAIGEDPKVLYKLVFETLDEDHSGHLDKDEIVEALALFGIEITKEEAANAISQFDKDGDGLVSLQEFLDTFVHV